MRNIERLVLSISVVSVVGCGGAPAPPFKLVSDTKTLMNSVIEKEANVVWESVGTIATLEGVEERRPQTEADWQHIRDAAVTITESANLLMMSPHAKDDEEWMAASVGLIDEGQRMISAIDRKSTQEVFDVGADLYEACVRCHRQYMPGVAIMYRR
ncbi:MAG: hypothetical protein FJW27_18245 [Acidimicrobiia bacterium]|nr:hypothetical protein [Acidimicrobiia bacterium]